MFFIFFLLFLIFFLLVFLQVVAYYISEFMNKGFIREEMTPYECGFEFSSDSRLPFSMRYFLLTLVFLVFDLELVFLIYLPMLFNYFSLFSLILVIIFLMVLFFGLLFEWKSGVLDWGKN